MFEFFTIEQKPLPNNHAVMLRLKGSLDSHTYEELEETFASLFTGHQSRIVVDLSALEFISSVGAGVFIGAISDARKQNGIVVLFNPSEAVNLTFNLIGLIDILNVVADEETALSLLG